MADSAIFVSIDELLSPARCYSIEDGLRQYKDCFMVNIGDGPGRTRIPLSRLERITNTSLLSMNIRRHDHQTCIMTSIRSILEDAEAKKQAANALTVTLGATALVGDVWGDVSPALSPSSSSSSSSSSSARRPKAVGSAGLSGAERKEADVATQRALSALVHQRTASNVRASNTSELRRRPSNANDVYASSHGQGDETLIASNGQGSTESASKVSSPSHASDMKHFLSQVAHLRSAVKALVQQACAAVQCSSGYMVFCDTRNKRLWWFAEGGSAHPSPKTPSKKNKNKNGPANALFWSCDPNLSAGGVASTVLHSASPLAIEDASTDTRFDAGNEPYLRHSVRSLLAVPVAPKGSNRGTHDTCAVLVLVNKEPPSQGFVARTQDERTAQGLAERCAGALEDLFFGCLESSAMQEWLSQELHHNGH